MSRLLFVTLSNIGDLVLTTPALMALHQQYPTALIDIVADQRSSELLRHSPFLGTLFHRDKSEGWPGMLRLVQALRRTRYEAVVDLRTDWLPWLLRTRKRSTRRTAQAQAPHSAAQHFQVVAALMPSERAIPPSQVWFGTADRAAAAGWLATAPGRRLAIAPGANWPPKCWPPECFAACVQALRHAFDSVVVLGSPADASAAAEVSAAAGLPVLDLTGQTSLCQAAAVLQDCAAFIGNDSGLGHLAAAVGLPVVTVFGPGKPERYRPWGPRTALCHAPGQDLARLDPSVVAQQMLQLLAG